MRPTALRALNRSRTCKASSSAASPLARLRSSPLSRHVKISEEVRDALHRGQPIVSLETAITSHGLPYDKAVHSADSLNKIIRGRGAVPAVIGLVDGVIKVGLSDAEVELLANPETSDPASKWKVGRRDLAPALVKGVHGGTTVSATSFLSHLVGIDVFVTGGIGGVHRGAQETMDISSDLTELGRTPTTVVCAGAKSILDIGLTLEYLETLGVTTVTFGENNAFPAFYARDSGFTASANVRTAREAAQLIYYSELLKAETGILLGVPIPEEYEAKSKPIQDAVEQAIREAQENGVAKKGKEVTPWILARVKELTSGGSVESNMALIENNANVGAGIAVELAKLKQSGQAYTELNFHAPRATSAPTPRATPTTPSGLEAPPEHDTRAPPAPCSLMVVGAAAVDIVSRPDANAPHSTSPGTVSLTLGGVGRNVYEAAFRTGASDALLVAPIGSKGSDPMALVLQEGLSQLGASDEALIPVAGRTPTISMMLDAHGDLLTGVADTSAVEGLLGSQVVERISKHSPKIVCFDGNLPAEVMKDLLQYCHEHGIITAFEPTSDPKSLRLLQAIDFSRSALTHMTPNIHEVRALNTRISNLSLFDTSPYFRQCLVGFRSTELFRNAIRKKLPPWVTEEGVVQMAMQLLPFVECLWIKAGRRGLLVMQRIPRSDGAAIASWKQASAQPNTVTTDESETGLVAIRYYDALPLKSTASVVGGGDSLLGAILAGLTKGVKATHPDGLDRLARIGQSAAVASLSSANSVGNLQDLKFLLH